ncbi:MAG: malic enzyme-like NAD(P)-binding protein [Nitrospinota bacterium]|nr:malic enzyme-like NAD(P)-binding protein [Nitrospinota bacterium]
MTATNELRNLDMAGENFSPNAGDSIIVRLKIDRYGATLAKVTTKIAELDGILGAIDIVRPVSKEGSIRDFSIYTRGPEHADKLVAALDSLEGVELIQHSDRTFLLHLGGKIEMTNRKVLKTRDDLSMAYTPGVGRVCTAIQKNPEDVYKLTIKKNTVAIVTDGTAVLGLGDIGPEAALPVMEGKAMLFKEFAGVDAFPICLDTKNAEEIIKVVKAIAPGFGGINLEDIAAPQCFEIEKRLIEELNIPVFHDDQHGTAVVVTAALINALKLLNKKPEAIKVVVLGAGAAGTACTKMIQQLKVSNIVVCDRKGAIHQNRKDLNEAKLWFSQNTNPNNETGTLNDVMAGADVFFGLSGPGLLSVDDVKKMGKDAVVFAMANPIPEIMPEEAAPYVAVMATGRSDYSNQINNVLCFPGMFRGALDCLASGINEEMKIAAAHAIASCIPDEHLQPEYIIPSAFNQDVVKNVSKAVTQAARETGMVKKRGRTSY